MANLSAIKLPNGTTYNLKDNGALQLTGGQVTGPVTFGDSVYVDDLTAGQLVVEGSASVANNLQANTINGVTVGSSPKFTDTITTVSTTGSGNAITAISASNGALTATKGTTFLTAHNTYTISTTGSGNAVTAVSLSGTTFTVTKGATYSNNAGTVTKVIAGTGLAIGTTAQGNFTTSGTINHTNSITAQTTQAVYPIKIDAQGHISAYGSAVTIPTKTSQLTNDSGYITNAGVTGVKGNSESTYRTGQVNLTAANIGAAAASHTHSANDLNGGYINIHPENSPIIIPFIHNDIAHLLKRGGSVSATYDGNNVSYDFTGAFDGSGSYVSVSSSTYSTLVLTVNLHKQFTWTNTIYIDFGAAGWRAKSIKIEVINSNYANDVWTQKYNTTTNSLGHVYVTFGHTPVGASNAGGGYNKIRFTLSDFNSTDRRIAQIGVYFYGSLGVRETYMSRGADDYVFRDITPNSNNTYNLGSSSNKWANIYATTLNGSLAWSNVSSKPTATGSSATGITASTTATKTTLGTAFTIPNVTGVGSASTWAFEEISIPNVTSVGSASTWSFSNVTVPIRADSDTTVPTAASSATACDDITAWSAGSGSYTQGSFSGGSGSFSATVTNHVLSFSHTHTAATHGTDSHSHTAPSLSYTARSITGVSGSTTVRGVKTGTSSTTTASKASGGNGSAPTLGTAIKVQSKKSGANSTVPTLGTAFSVPNVTGNTSATVSITDPKHTHTIS